MKPRDYFKHFDKIEGMEQQFVNYFHEDYVFILTRFEKIRTQEGKEPSYLFFIYIIRKERIVDKKECKDIICFNKVYHSYEEFMDNLLMITGEYIFEQSKYNKCITLAEKLNPDYFEQ